MRVAAYGATLLALSVLASPALAQEQEATQPTAGEPQEVSVTVYSSADPASFDPQQFIAQQRAGRDPMFAWQVPGFAVVKEVRTATLAQGLNTLRYTDVAQFIDPTTVSFDDLTTPDRTAVLEQQFQFDLVNPQKLLEKYIDRPITALVPLADGGFQTVEGTLLSANQGQLVIQTNGGVRLLQQHQAQVQLGELPGGLITKPTLLWLLHAQVPGEHRIRSAYQTAGLTWRADYNLILNESDTQASLGAWVTLLNLSGATYPNARLKLIAGDVQRIQPRSPVPYMARGQVMPLEAAANMAAFEEKPFFEYHLYTLPRPTTIAQNTTQQITLFPTAHDVDVEKVLVYYGLPQAGQWGFFPNPILDRQFGNQSNKKVDVYIRFQNEKENNLGMPMPRGKVRVFKEDPDDETLEFVGEDLIDHTPRDEEVLIKIGQAFDVVGERTQTNFTLDQRAHVMTESFRIELRNHKDEAVKVIVKENLYRWVNWEITQASHDYEKVDARTIHFPVEVEADGEEVITYTVKYTW